MAHQLTHMADDAATPGDLHRAARLYRDLTLAEAADLATATADA